MGRPTKTSIAALLGALLAVGLAACGSEDAELLPGGTAREITTNLDSVQQLADEGDCAGAEGAALQVSEQVDALGGVDPKLKEALRDGADRLNEVVAECEEEPEETVAAPEAPTEFEEEESEKDAKKAEKEEEKAAKEREKEERKEEKGPPPSNNDDEGPSEAQPPPPEETPSGGVEPASPVEEDEDSND